MSAPDSSQAERALYSKIYAKAPESVFLVDPQGALIRFANPKAQEDTSYELTELEGLDFRALFLPEDKEALEALLQATLKWNNGSDPVRVLRRKSGKKIFVEISTLLIDFGGKPTIAASVRDITARVKAEHKVREYSRELEKINAELEDRVDARTAELGAANDKLQETNRLITERKKELDDVMGNIRQAILTIAPSGRINPELSRFSYEVFGPREIAGTDLIELLFGPEERATRGESLRSWLGTVYEQPGIWDIVKDFGVRELSYLRPAEGGAPEKRDLKFEWRPIFEGPPEALTTAKMMLVAWDVTEQKQLEAEIAKKETEHREELELISQLIHLPREVVEQFVSDFERNLREGMETLALGTGAVGPEGIKILLRALHTIKGSAKQFRLASIQRRAHELETRLIAHRDSPQDDDFHAQVLAEFEALERALKDILGIYSKVTQGGQSTPGGAFQAGPVFPVPLEKVDSLIRRVFSNEGPVPAPAVRRALAWLVQEPVSNLFDRLQALAETLAPELGKEVVIEREGDSIQLDHRLLAMLFDAFSHAVRNSLDHGAETVEERTAAAKPSANRIRLIARKLEGNGIEIEVRDDGRGIDSEVIRAKAIEKGLVSHHVAQSATIAEVLPYVFLPGLTTRDVATPLSGRGVGLDVLQETVEKRLHGKAYIQSTRGKETRIGARFDAHALIGGTVNALGYVASAELRTAWEQLFGIHLKEPGSGDGLPLLSDMDSAKAAILDARERALILGDLETREVIDKVIGEMGARHFVHRRSRHAAPYVRTTLRKLAGDFTWGLEPYLWPAASVATRIIERSTQKSDVIHELTQWARKLKGFSGMPEILGTIADEMIMNATYDAPRDLFGEAKYNQRARNEEVLLEGKEQPRFRFGADPETVGLSIEDKFGALDLDTVLASIQRAYVDGPKRDGGAGAGMGLYMIFEHSHAFIVNSKPGGRTEVIALISRGRSYEEYQRSGRCFSFFTV